MTRIVVASMTFLRCEKKSVDSQNKSFSKFSIQINLLIKLHMCCPSQLNLLMPGTSLGHYYA